MNLVASNCDFYKGDLKQWGNIAVGRGTVNALCFIVYNKMQSSSIKIKQNGFLKNVDKTESVSAEEFTMLCFQKLSSILRNQCVRKNK